MARWLPVLLLASACVASHADADSAAVSTSVAPDTAPPRTARDSLIARARAVLAASRPTFREWPATAYAPVRADSNYPTAQTAPLVGDFDGDSLPDVAFDGYEGRTHIMPVVLVGKEKQVVVPFVQAWVMPDPPKPMLSRLMVVEHLPDGRSAQGIMRLAYAEDGRLLSTNTWVLVNGVFMQFLDGE